MSSKITFSSYYLTVLKNILKFFNDLPDRNHVLIFKNDNNVVISSMTMNILVNITTTQKHVRFEGEHIGITNLASFMQYIEAIDYIKNKDASIEYVEEKTTKGNKFNSFMFSDKYGTYRMPVANFNVFDKKHDMKIPVSKEKDPLELVSSIYFTNDDVKKLVKDISLMDKTGVFAVSIVYSKLKIYMKGLNNQQFSRSFESTKVKCLGDYTTKTDKYSYKLFTTKIFDYMSYFGCDFNLDLRLMKNNNMDIMAAKAYGTIEIENDAYDNINVFIGSHESSADAIASNFDIVE